jgi:hypothetical protein
MSKSAAFIQGRCYFIVSYADEDLRFPLIETYVYVGIDIYPHGSGNKLWYFKQPDAFVKSGNSAEESERNDFVCLDEATLGLVSDIPDLVGKLTEVEGRLDA